MNYTRYYNLKKPSMNDTADIGDLNDNFDIIASTMHENQVTSENAISDLADAFSISETYAVDDLVIYENQLYKCTTAITTAGVWDSTKWSQTTLSNEIGTGGTHGIRQEYSFSASASRDLSFSDIGITRKGAYLLTITSNHNQVSNGWQYAGIIFYSGLYTSAYVSSIVHTITYANISVTINEQDETLTIVNNNGNYGESFLIEVLPISNNE